MWTRGSASVRRGASRPERAPAFGADATASDASSEGRRHGSRAARWPTFRARGLAWRADTAEARDRVIEANRMWTRGSASVKRWASRSERAPAFGAGGIASKGKAAGPLRRASSEGRRYATRAVHWPTSAGLNVARQSERSVGAIWRKVATGMERDGRQRRGACGDSSKVRDQRQDERRRRTSARAVGCGDHSGSGARQRQRRDGRQRRGQRRAGVEQSKHPYRSGATHLAMTATGSTWGARNCVERAGRSRTWRGW